jgi:hypothetical protein
MGRQRNGAEHQKHALPQHHLLLIRDVLPSQMPLQFDALSPFLGEADTADLMATRIRLVGTLASADAEQRNHSYTVGDVERGLYLVFEEAFHRRRVIAENLRHPHHGSDRDHHMAVDPYGVIRGKAELVARRLTEDAVYALPHCPILLFAEAMPCRFREHVVEIFATRRV